MGRSPLKRLRKGLSHLGLAVSVPVLDHLFRGVFRSSRILTVGSEALENLRTTGRTVLFSYWHCWAIHHLYRFSGGGHVTMSSRKDAGELGYRVLSRHGYATARGASGVVSSRGWKDRGGKTALAEMARIVSETGCDAGLTVDGPHGPPLRVKPGIVLLARETGAAIVPMAVASRPRLRLPTWDRMHLPLPFSRIVYLFGEPLEVPPEKDAGPWEPYLEVLQDRMADLSHRADGWFNCRPTGS
jgi:lysophospholipid acyltransferase (LPLAT)-like uncharacterized protein